MTTVVAIIPAHEEAARIAATVRATLAVPGITRVIVVDDGSRDETARLAEDAGAKVIRLFSNVGKGAALETAAGRAEDADVILLLDADLGDSAAQASLLLDPVLDGRADIAIAKFPRPEGKAGFGLVKGLARFGIARLGGPGFVPEAPLSGQRALTAAAMNAVRPLRWGYGAEVAITIRALRAGLTISEVETTMRHAATGRDLAGFVHRGRQFTQVAGALLLLAFERRSQA